MYQLRITIEGIEPPVWRTITVSENYSFYKLHHIIQKVFGWHNSHLWCFLTGDDDSPITNPFLWRKGTPRWDKNIKLKTLLKKVGDSILYEYDTGDRWKHTIILEKATEEKIKKPLCIDGKRAGPRENCGGATGYKEMFHHLLHPEKDGYLELLEWLGDDYDPESFNIADINKNLKGLNFFIKYFDWDSGLVITKVKNKPLRPSLIPLTENEEVHILGDYYEDFCNIATSKVFCSQCADKHKYIFMRDITVALNSVNDFELAGRCNICMSSVGRYVEYGDIPEISRRAEAFRDLYQSRKSTKVVKKRK